MDMNTNSPSWTTGFEEILKDDNMPVYIGSPEAINSAKSLSDSKQFRPPTNNFYILQNIINDNAMENVGGDIQYGCLDNENNFHVSAVEIIKNENDPKDFEYKHIFCGFDMNDEAFLKEVSEYIFVSYKMICPY